MLPESVTYFTMKEILECSDTKKYLIQDIPAELRENINPTVMVLDELRKWYGKPLLLSSGFRDAEHNAKVRGSLNSLHTKFNALDFYPQEPENIKKLYDQLCKWDAEHYFKFLPRAGSMGLGLYLSRFIHIDTRATIKMYAPARWFG